MENLLIKLNNIIVDVKASQDKAIKKSIEFFLGRMIDMQEINDLRHRFCPMNHLECVNLFLNENGLYLRENAIMKKFLEYFRGREYDGFIKDVSLIVEKKRLKKLCNAYNITVLSLMPEEDAGFIMQNLELGNIGKMIAANCAKEGILAALKEMEGKVSYVGNDIMDYRAAMENKVDFIGLKMDKPIKGALMINNLDEIF